MSLGLRVSLGLAVVRTARSRLHGLVTHVQSSPTPFLGDSSGHEQTLFQRRAVIAASIATFREVPFHRVTVDQIAPRAGVSREDVLKHFPTWDGLLLATLDRWNIARMIPIQPLLQTHGTVWFLRGIVTATAEDPALTRFLVAMLNIAATPDEPLAPLLVDRWNDFQRLVEHNLAIDVELGREPSTMTPASGAEQLIAIYEGLQLQFMVRPGMDLVASFDRAVTRIREGWGRSYTPPVWDIGPAA